jgi:chloramphenicol-sensitive protein RarD
MATEQTQQQGGLIATAGAFAIWGIVVVFWKQLGAYGSLELILHRLLWGCFFGVAILALRGTLPQFLAAFGNRRQLRIHFINGILISVNWLAYVYAITHDHILEGSLAYFMVPILNTAMGFLILKEKLRKLQWIAIALATLGVLNEVLQFGRIPWLALIMAVTFAIYGMNKTRSELGPVTALTLEITLMLPFAIIAWVVLGFQGSLVADPASPADWGWMMATGIITIVPLILFAYGARRIQLTTIGLFQFIAPSIKFFLGVFLYKEPFDTTHLITFAFIWVALAVYLAHLFRRARHRQATSRPH